MKDEEGIFLVKVIQPAFVFYFLYKNSKGESYRISYCSEYDPFEFTKEEINEYILNTIDDMIEEANSGNHYE